MVTLLRHWTQLVAMGALLKLEGESLPPVASVAIRYLSHTTPVRSSSLEHQLLRAFHAEPAMNSQMTKAAMATIKSLCEDVRRLSHGAMRILGKMPCSAVDGHVAELCGLIAVDGSLEAVKALHMVSADKLGEHASTIVHACNNPELLPDAIEQLTRIPHTLHSRMSTLLGLIDRKVEFVDYEYQHAMRHNFLCLWQTIGIHSIVPPLELMLDTFYVDAGLDAKDIKADIVDSLLERIPSAALRSNISYIERLTNFAASLSDGSLRRREHLTRVIANVRE